jgi:hypothetical protein
MTTRQIRGLDPSVLPVSNAAGGEGPSIVCRVPDGDAAERKGPPREA